MYDSTLCVSASMPVAAVTFGGKSSVSSGSANTAVASSFTEKIIFLICVVSSEITLDRPHLRMVPCIFEHAAGMDGHQRDRFRDVERRAAAQTDHRIRAMLPERGNAGIDLA